MELKEYAEKAKRTDAPMPDNYDQMHAVHMILGMVTETAELADVFKKNLAYGKPIDWVNVGEEVADVMWYIMNFCSNNNIDLGFELDKNIKKLEARYPEKFTEEKALNRDLKTERTILEEKL